MNKQVFFKCFINSKSLSHRLHMKQCPCVKLNLCFENHVLLLLHFSIIYVDLSCKVPVKLTKICNLKMTKMCVNAFARHCICHLSDMHYFVDFYTVHYFSHCPSSVADGGLPNCHPQAHNRRLGLGSYHHAPISSQGHSRKGCRGDGAGLKQ